jgi:LuxR family transcriptional regulator, maltose regulon positive regulatory protein
VDQVLRLIKANNTLCPDLHYERWPWPVRLFGLGSFELRFLEEHAAPSGKPQHKLLEVLKALIALAKDGVGSQELADALWPDTEGDSAQNSLQVSIYRLRKLLGRDDVIQMHDAKISINRQVCWVDAWAVEDKVEELRSLHQDRPEYERLATAALKLYRGHFLGREKEQPWMLAPRERLRNQWRGIVRGLGRNREDKGDWVSAAEHYRRALDIDPIAEEIYRRLMICLSKVGDRAEAINAYSRCKEQLTAQLGVPPSAETERLYQSLRQPSP